MSYEPINWEALPSKKTPLSAANFNHMDEGIKAAHTAIGDNTTIAGIGDGTIAGALTTHETEITDQKKKTSALETKYNELNTNLGGFSFATVDNEDGYYKGDGEFHPFGNPYLRFNEDTGWIEAKDENDEWVSLAYVGSLPIGKYYLYYLNDMKESITGGWTGGTINADGYLYWKSAGQGNTTKYIQTNKAIDTLGYKYCVFEFEEAKYNSYAYITYHFGTKSGKIGATGSSADKAGTYSLDISSLTSGVLKFGIFSGSESSEYGEIKVKSIYLTNTLP